MQRRLMSETPFAFFTSAVLAWTEWLAMGRCILDLDRNFKAKLTATPVDPEITESLLFDPNALFTAAVSNRLHDPTAATRGLLRQSRHAASIGTAIDTASRMKNVDKFGVPIAETSAPSRVTFDNRDAASNGQWHNDPELTGLFDRDGTNHGSASRPLVTVVYPSGISAELVARIKDLNVRTVVEQDIRLVALLDLVAGIRPVRTPGDGPSSEPAPVPEPVPEPVSEERMSPQPAPAEAAAAVTSTKFEPFSAAAISDSYAAGTITEDMKDEAMRHAPPPTRT